MNLLSSFPRLSKRIVVRCALIFLAFSVQPLAFLGCTTVHPVHSEASAASFDGGVQDSGFLGWSTNAKTGEVSGILTPHARDRYNALCLAYGKRFTPPLAQDSGLTAGAIAGIRDSSPNGDVQLSLGEPATWIIDREHLVKFATMNRWRKENLKP